MKVVLDTNILISALGWLGNSRWIIGQIIDKKLNLAISLDILDEFHGVAARLKFEFSEEEITDFIDSIMEVAELVVPVEKLEIIKDDPSDNKILECAIEARVDYIISGDRHLLKLKEFKGIKIVTAAQFLTIFQT